MKMFLIALNVLFSVQIYEKKGVIVQNAPRNANNTFFFDRFPAWQRVEGQREIIFLWKIVENLGKKKKSVGGGMWSKKFIFVL
ncbi:MAG: hypothetical protein IIW59_03375 [Alistipes sp.]|nr:hypothetical protein [Alistipes sp.]